ncbi:Mss4-like protein [Fusarium oxysporum]|nr:Mss4-like protein [Fusarium oxysporum]KAK2684490.1 hypothetical protein QWA68_016593 [Fusarium oxysporum]
MTTTSSGACLCGAVAYIYTDEPAMRAVCYCSPCRKISGGTNTVNFIIPEANFTLTKGQPRSFSKEHEYGMTLIVVFCSECGTTLWKEATAPQFKGVKLVQAGTLSDAKKLDAKLDAELYVPERASWLRRLDEAAQKESF